MRLYPDLLGTMLYVGVPIWHPMPRLDRAYPACHMKGVVGYLVIMSGFLNWLVLGALHVAPNGELLAPIWEVGWFYFVSC